MEWWSGCQGTGEMNIDSARLKKKIQVHNTEHLHFKPTFKITLLAFISFNPHTPQGCHG